MSSQPPKLDQRSYAELVQQTQALAESYTPWRAAPNSGDVGLALVRIFGRMASLVQERLNQVPERNRLAFMNLVGTQLTPPQAARSPLTFELAAGSPVDALVPALTQIAAPPPEGEEAEVIFETERELLVTATQVKAMFVIEDRDYYSDRCANVFPDAVPPAFEVLKGDRPVEHYLYLHGAEVFDLPKLTTVQFAIATDSPASATQLASRFLDWQAWDGKQWQVLPAVAVETEAAQVLITLTQLPKLKEVEVNGRPGKWLRITLYRHRREALPEILQILVSASVDQTQTPQDCLFNNITLDLSKDFYPLGTAPDYNDTFQVALDPRLIQPGVAIALNATLSHAPSYTEDLHLVWDVGDGQTWTAISPDPDPAQFHWLRNSEPPQFVTGRTQGTFRFPDPLPPHDPHTAEPTYWLRARLVQGRYGSRGRVRHYVTYNEMTMLAVASAVGQTAIVVDSADEIQVGDTIRLQDSRDLLIREDLGVMAIAPNENRVILNRATRQAYSIGSRVLGKFTIAESSPDVVDPPCLAALTVTYQFFLEQPAVALAYNDFTYGAGSPLEAFLHRPARAGDRRVQLEEVKGLSLGEFLRFADGSGELGQIELIDPASRWVVFTAPLTADHKSGVKLTRAFYPLTPPLHRDSAFYLGFNQAFPNRPSTLYLQVQSPEPDEVAPGTHRSIGDGRRLVWEYPTPEGWRSLTVRDETAAITEKGLVQFIGPTDWIASPHFGQQHYWLRVRQQPNTDADIPLVLLDLWHWAIRVEEFRLYGLMRYLFGKVRDSADLTVPPRLVNARTNTTWARQAITLNAEILGSSQFEPGQVVTTSQAPILAGQTLDIEEGRFPSEAEQQQLRQQWGTEAITPVYDEMGELEAVWVRWQEVPDFYSSAAGDRHYTLDVATQGQAQRQRGRIQFGNGQAGMIPPRGRNNIRLSYRTGGGDRGNQPAQTIVELKTTIPYIAGVINWEAAEGGNDQESLARLKVRSPQRLRHRDRAVTAQDFADLAYDAAVEVARVQVITPEMLVPDFNPLLEELWVEPDRPQGPASSSVPGNEIDVFDHENEIRAGRVRLIIVPQSNAPQPLPTLALLNQVEQFLRARFVATMRLQVCGPKWQAIGVTVDIVPVSITNAGTVKAAVEAKLQEFLHPLTGGRQGQGWDFGRIPHRSDLFAALEAVPGVSYVSSLEIDPANRLIDRQTLIYSGTHRITLKLPEATP
ncbi:putative baseplate assembly protein [Spirulina sp. CCNP1310]|uniref:putative baseplate assembly protein n=1 Tax=Spirulina sp. CCNP1310 TaxID=3110249 RepID=UPI002B1F58DB|nr:putative baseplate assembly protein [Spirulina sp. CCNP1310]MEA5418993.1 putative baseplate assembly protein [Spirulina sp. CCNP1310]